MSGRQSEKTTIKVRERGEETDGGRESRGAGRKRKQIINNLLRGHLVQPLVLVRGVLCRMLYSVGKPLLMI